MLTSRKRLFIVFLILSYVLAAFLLYQFVFNPLLAVKEKVEPNVTELKTIVTEFLETTDVSNAGLLGTIEILEICDHKLSGWVIVVRYVTTSAVHPHFMCEAIEEHVAVITLNHRGEVVSAFCVWGSFHGLDKFWDLVNQRWAQKG